MIRYRPARGFHGTDSFHYTLTTPNGSADAKVTVNVSRLSRHLHRPTARKDRAHTNEGDAVRIQVLHNDSPNHSGRLHIVSTTSPHHGTVTRHKHFVVYHPAPGFTGHDRFTYQIRNHGGTDTATVRITVHDHDGDNDGD
jgi:hypothetical protein